ncbi:hypothetical protein [Streptomyces sp. NPDC001985]|uniref:hypothetical protein n=1 Tax=Streptomyces sp. NPDC001985 TaxID=3154406 RepID=UPI00331CF8BD
MKPRATHIAALLRAGHSNADISRRTHVDPHTIAAIRTDLGIPKTRRGRSPVFASPEAAYWARTTPDGVHLQWTGRRDTFGTAVFDHRCRTHTALRIAFQIRHGREPVGKVRAGCDYPRCVAPGCVEDQPMRARNKTAFAAIFGQAS